MHPDLLERTVGKHLSTRSDHSAIHLPAFQKLLLVKHPAKSSL